MRRRAVLSIARSLRNESKSVGESITCGTQYVRQLTSIGINTVPSSQNTPRNFGGYGSLEFISGRKPGARSFASSPGWENTLYPESELEIGCPAPDFSLEAVVDGDMKTVNLSDYKGKYVVLFWYPKDFTFVCPTEIIAFSDRAKEFEALNCQLLAASTDSPEVHLAWIKTPRTLGGLGYMQIPILADITKSVAARYGVLKEEAGIALRGLYIINPEGIVEHATINNFPIGRSVDETLRTLQAIQHVAQHGEVCPAGWKPGDKAMIADPEKSLDYFQSAAASHVDDVKETMLQQLSEVGQFEGLIASGKKVLVKFWAPWCGKCRQMGPFVEEMAQKYGDKITFASIDTTNEKMETFCADLGVKGLPAFRFYSGGEEDTSLRLLGYKKQGLEENIKKALE